VILLEAGDWGKFRPDGMPAHRLNGSRRVKAAPDRMKCGDFSPRRHEGDEASFRNVIVVIGDVCPIFVPS
jgi:hypothetical protein